MNLMVMKNSLLATLVAGFLLQSIAHADSDLNPGEWGPEGQARGAVLATNLDQIGLLQYGDSLTNDAIVVYNFCALTELPVDRPLATGDAVAIDFYQLPNDEKLATRIQRWLPESVVTTETLALGSNQVPALGTSIPLPGGNDSGIASEAEAQPDSAQTPDSSLGQSDAAASRFGFGKVLSFTAESVTVLEYDFAKDADETIRYRLLPETEYGNINDEHPLQVGDDVVLDYSERSGQRFVSTFVREEPVKDLTDAELVPAELEPSLNADNSLASENDRFSFGKVMALTCEDITVREYDFAKDLDVETVYQLLPETETGNIDAEHPLQVGDDVVLDYLEQDGQRLVTTLVRELPEETVKTFNAPTESTPPAAVELTL